MTKFSSLSRVVLLLAIALDSTVSLTVKDNGAGFTVSVTSGGRAVLQHTETSPLLFVGSGTVSFVEDSGNFVIDNKVFSRVPLYDYKISQKSSTYNIDLSFGQINVRLLLAPRDNGLEIYVDKGNNSLNNFWLRLPADATEEVYGGGEQYSFVNLRQRDRYVKNVFPLWVSEQGIGRNKSTLTTFLADTHAGDAGGDYYTTYFCQPTFVSTKNYFFHHEGTNYGVLDFTGDDHHEIFVHGEPGKFYITESDSLLNTVGSLSKFLGQMPLLPEWIQERAIISLQGGTSVLKEKYQLAEKYQIPISGIWIQDWSGQIKTDFGTRVNWNWQWDSKLYAGLDTLIKEWKDKGVRILGYINPNLAVNGSMYTEAEKKDYLVKNSQGKPYIRKSVALLFGQVDFTNPEAFEWYKNVIKNNMIGLGLGGWMADFSEYLAADAVLHDGRTGVEAHNEWPVLWARCNREAVEEAQKLRDVVFFMRAGFSGSTKYSTLFWDGDQNVDFSLSDGIRSTIYSSTGSGMNGVTFTHFDIGGYTTFPPLGLVRTEELLIRSAEYAAFTPVFRTHEGNNIEFNIQWYTERATASFAKHARVFAQLADYRKSVSQESVDNGWPAMRLTRLVFPNNTEPVPFDQYMFGNDLLVAPVYHAGAYNRSVTFPKLPDGVHWKHVWSDAKELGGQTKVVVAPLGFPAAYFRSDSKFVSTLDTLKYVKVEPLDNGAMVGTYLSVLAGLCGCVFVMILNRLR